MNWIKVSIILTLILTAAASPALAEETLKKTSTDAMMIVAGQSISIETILKHISRMTGLEVIADPKITKSRAQIKFVSDIRADYVIIEAVLKVNNVLLEKRIYNGKKVIRVFDKGTAGRFLKYETTDIYEEDQPLPDENQLVTRLFFVKYADARQVETTMGKMIDRGGTGNIMAVRNHPILIVRGFAPQVKYYGTMIRLLDRKPVEMNMYVIQISYAYADEIANMINSVRSKRRAPVRASGVNTEPYIVADRRTNKLIVYSMPEDIEEIRDLVKELDTKLHREYNLIHVYNLKNTDAKLLATALQSIFSNRPSRRTPRSGPGGPPGAPGQQDVPSRVVADEQTNSLIIEADQRSYDEIVEVIKKLDVRRPQVFIEAAIIEVSASSALNFGFELATIDLASEKWRAAFGTNYGLTQDLNFETLEKIPKFGTGLTGFMFKEKLGRIPLLLQAVQAESDLNVLSQPRILTNDNQKGEIDVSDSVPVFRTVDTQTGQSRTELQGFEKAGITLSITPHISADDYLRLEINLVVEDFERSLSAAGGVPGKKTRKIIGELTIPDKEIVVIGGLTTRKINKVVNKVPILGDIPIIGSLFRYTSESEEKRNLYIFICPHIMRDDMFEDLVRETTRHRQEARDIGGQIPFMERLMERRWGRTRFFLDSPLGEKIRNDLPQLPPFEFGKMLEDGEKKDSPAVEDKEETDEPEDETDDTGDATEDEEPVDDNDDDMEVDE